MAEKEKAEEKPEEELTNEERLAWLRARGVLVEEPASRRKPASIGGGGPSFKLVKIPLDDAMDCEELSCPVADGDALPSFLAPKFAAGADSLSDDALLKHAAANGQSVSPAALRSVMAQGGAESFRLAIPTDDNGRKGVYAYLDEASSLKGLPVNARASALAQKCGFPGSCHLCGDIYVGRQQWKEGGLVENVDFNLPEVENNLSWATQAIKENLEFQKNSNPEGHHEAQMGAASDKPAEGEGDGHRWQDQGDEVEIMIDVEKSTRKQDIKVDFKKQEVRMTKPVALILKLFKPIETDGCNWTMGDGKVVLTLEKSSAGPWPQLLQD